NLLMRYEGRLNRQFRLDLDLLERLQRRRRDERDAPRAAFAAIVGLSTTDPSSLPYMDDLSALEEGPSLRALAPAEPPASQPLMAFAERADHAPAARPAPRDSLGDPVARSLP